MISDIEPNYVSSTPRSGMSIIVQLVKNEWEKQGVKIDEIFKMSKMQGKTYGAKADITASIRSWIPTLSREAVDKMLSGFKEDKINYSDFLVYFDVKEAKIKTEESKDKAQQKWVKYYTEAWNKNNVDAMEIVKEADVNKDNKLDLKELEAIAKQYLKSPIIEYKELQHILDWFDANNDGIWSIQEYKDAILKYGVKNEFSLSDKEKKDFIMLAKKKWSDNKTSLKTALSEYEFNEKWELSVQFITRGIKSATEFSQADAKKLVDIMTNDPEAKSISAEHIFSFYDEYLSEDPNISLELKLILAKKIFEDSPSILKYLEVELSMDPEKDILLKEFTQTMRDWLEIQKSSSEYIYNQITSFNNKKIQPRLLEFYGLILNERDKDKVIEEAIDPKSAFSKLSTFLKSKYKGSKTALTDLGKEHGFEFSSKGSDSTVHTYNFFEIFCDLNEVLTAREALCLFEDTVLGINLSI